jgi:hypothetical protein
MDALANLVVVVHLAYFVFVVGGFVSIVIGAKQKWKWVYNPWFRIIHLLAVFVVLVEDVLQVPCPLNILEGRLRAPVPSPAEASSEIGYVLDLLLHHTIPGWFLDGMYWVLGVVLLVLIFIVRPHFRKNQTERRLEA